MAAGPVFREAGALLGCVGQFDEGVGQFHAADEQLEPFGDAGISGVAPGQGSLGGGPVGEERGAIPAEPRFDAFQQQAEEQVLPGLVRAQFGTGGAGERGGVIRGSEHVGAGVAGEGVGDGQALEAGEIGGYAAAGDAIRQDGAQEGLRLVHQPGQRLVGRIPFQHGEFVRVQGAALAVAPDAGQLEDLAGAGDQQLLHGEFGAGVQPERFGSAVGADAGGREGGQVDLLAGRGDGVGRFHLQKAVLGEEGARLRRQPCPAVQERHSVGQAVRVPDGLRHWSCDGGPVGLIPHHAGRFSP